MPGRSGLHLRGDLEFESLAFRVEPRRERAEVVARRAVRRAFPGQRWKIVPVQASKGELEAVPVGARGTPRLTSAAAWARSYRLRDQPEVVYAEPLFTVSDWDQHVPAVVPRSARSAGGEDDPRTEAQYEWSLKKMFVHEAWALFADGRPGQGIKIGHPDTGYTAHPEIAGSRLRADLGFDFEDNDSNPADALLDGWLRNPGHGTGTASVIMSGAGHSADGDGPFVSGVAPFAFLVPIRTTKSVVLWSMSNLVHAIRYAVEKGCHVISISLGGPAPSRALHSAVQDAEAAGVVVLCAAGNQVRFVVFPAAFDEVIAVAASTIADEAWPASCRGPAVDITAPGASVWRAEVVKSNGSTEYRVTRGSGTSFAVAATAGLAALWLSYHGRPALIEKYGKDRLASVFKEVLQATCRTPAGWNTGALGPGIVHAGRLLEAPLPPVPRARGLRGLQRRLVSIDDDVLERVVHLLSPVPRSEVVRTLAELLKVDEGALPLVLQDVGDELAFNLAVDSALRERLIAASRRAPAAGRIAPAGPRGGGEVPTLRGIRQQLSESSSGRLRKAVRAAG